MSLATGSTAGNQLNIKLNIILRKESSHSFSLMGKAPTRSKESITMLMEGTINFKEYKIKLTGNGTMLRGKKIQW